MERIGQMRTLAKRPWQNHLRGQDLRGRSEGTQLSDLGGEAIAPKEAEGQRACNPAPPVETQPSFARPRVALLPLSRQRLEEIEAEERAKKQRRGHGTARRPAIHACASRPWCVATPSARARPQVRAAGSGSQRTTEPKRRADNFAARAKRPNALKLGNKDTAPDADPKTVRQPLLKLPPRNEIEA
eukprot:scaffold1804_cov263-Pinguiococcus_pyrenoidosus.AAC.32